MILTIVKNKLRLQRLGKGEGVCVLTSLYFPIVKENISQRDQCYSVLNSTECQMNGVHTLLQSSMILEEVEPIPAKVLPSHST